VKKRGRKHSPGEVKLLGQVATVFTEKKDKFGAKWIAKDLNISLASVYNYAAGDDLPRVEVLRDVQKKWKITWNLIDPSEMLKAKRIVSEKQLVFSFLEALRKENVEITKIGPEGETSVLQVTMKIRFTA
jgi:hypothetical protein